MRHTRLVFVGIGLTACMSLLMPAFADEKADRARDEAAIKQVAMAWQEGWNKHDAAGLAALLVEDVDFVTVVGPEGWLKGRKKFQDYTAEIHKRYFKDSVWTTKETRVRFLRPDVAVAHVLWSHLGANVPLPGRRPDVPQPGIFTWVLEKRDGKWLVVASQNTESPPPGIPRPFDEDKQTKPDK
jgi:uncharacterized protein (TIGR02246 family)